METLFGHAVQIVALPWDHTYVSSSDGYSWGCFGRDSGGHQICSGSGSRAIADCLSHPNSTAGIRYGVTGVCHQAANRILYPAKALVTRAKGYGASERAFSAFGRGPWPELQICFASASLHHGSGGVTVSGGTPWKRLLDRIFRIHRLVDDEGRYEKEGVYDVRTAELEARLDTILGSRLESRKRYMVLDIQEQLNKEQEKLANLFESNQISPNKYVEEANQMIHEYMARFEEVLGPRDYREVFGENLENSMNLIDADTFMEAHRH